MEYPLDLLIVTCRRCKRERRYRLQKPITDGIALSHYLDDTVGPCPDCAYDQADISARVAKDPKVN